MYSRLLIYDFTLFIMAAQIIFYGSWMQERSNWLRGACIFAVITATLKVLYSTFPNDLSKVSLIFAPQPMNALFALSLCSLAVLTWIGATKVAETAPTTEEPLASSPP
jgi:hypothetical protein